MKVSKYLGSDLIKIQCFLCLLKQDSVSPFYFPHSGFWILWYYCIIFHRDHKYFIVLHRDLLLYGFLKWKITRGNGFMAVSCSILCPKKINGRIYTSFPVFLGRITWLFEGLLRLHLTEYVKYGKKWNSLHCFLLSPAFPGHIKTDIKRRECLVIFRANIYLFKVNNRKPRKRCEVVQS